MNLVLYLAIGTLASILLIKSQYLGYIGIVTCFLLSASGAARGIWTISNYVSGTSIKAPRVGTKAIIGTVVCEANFLSGIISCILTYNILRGDLEFGNKSHFIFLCSNLLVGICSYFSSVSTGMICAVISLIDGKDSSLFFKIVVLEIIPASVGLIGFILGIVMSSKIQNTET